MGGAGHVSKLDEQNHIDSGSGRGPPSLRGALASTAAHTLSVRQAHNVTSRGTKPLQRQCRPRSLVFWRSVDMPGVRALRNDDYDFALQRER